MELKLNISPCPNDTFMFDAMLNGRIDTEGLTFSAEYRDIEELNREAAAGLPDASKISCAALPSIAGAYRLSDSGAALGRGNGPLLVRRAGDDAPIRRIAVPGLRTTANGLVERLFPEIGERVPMLFSEIAAAVERGEFDAGVLIHEGGSYTRDAGWNSSPTSGSSGSGARDCRCRWAASSCGGRCPTRCSAASNACCAAASNTLSPDRRSRATT